MKRPWYLQIQNGKGIKVQNANGGSYMQGKSFQVQKNAFIQLLDIELYLLLKRADSYITNWEASIAPALSLIHILPSYGHERQRRKS